MTRSILFAAAVVACTYLVSSVPAFAQQNTDWAKEKLEKSPRHIEWVKVKHGDREVNCFIAYPEVKDKATGGDRDSRNLWPDRLGRA